MESEKILNLIEKLYLEMQKGFKEVNGKVDNLEKIVIKIEHEHGEKLRALFDGYVQHSEKLDRIEKKVAEQDEIIFRRVK